MKIVIGADHAGFDLKSELVEYLTKKGHEVVDYGTDSVDRVDYPDYARIVSMNVASKTVDCGILVCGTGIGMSIAANKVRGIRAALVYNELTARLAKEHNHANVIALGARTQSLGEAKLIVDTYLNAHHESRHETRVSKIAKLEEENKR
ncbi:Ribose-5-phosphate isomerase B [Acholeplasma oculi]|uniref:Ribose 5-phosphate isomerase B n=1 Tax=Acholeplasma oculi TaxID=35623 RepID=A0A061ABU0_9MOLU|nr:ribose 5-phosphate isomerase B [Acholeplasma oculi]CDR31335.1 Ribose 5-phosphate isomerase B [Acholeplasma oculi]SKC39128.1 ribose 5-phosphate isomerase B [Acholeplasma oculi]SUT91668.1 Ribose-5-phosphate isomerase B [Acholeplasma oculi]